MFLWAFRISIHIVIYWNKEHVKLWACSENLLTPCHSSHSRSTDPRRRSPRWRERCCGCTRGLRWPLQHQKPESRTPYDSTQPPAAENKQKSPICELHDIHADKNLTQQDPQEPWSLISFRVGQFGHCALASNSVGSFTSPAYWTLQKSNMSKTCLWNLMDFCFLQVS